MSAFQAVTEMCRFLGYDPVEVRSTKRSHRLMGQRYEIAALLRPRYSLPELGRGMCRDHSSVLSLLRGGKGTGKQRPWLPSRKRALVEAGCGL